MDHKVVREMTVLQDKGVTMVSMEALDTLGSLACLVRTV